MEKLIVNLSLNEDEVNFVMAVLGELPTKSNAFILLSNIQGQVNQQLGTKAPPEGSGNEAS